MIVVWSCQETQAALLSIADMDKQGFKFWLDYYVPTNIYWFNEVLVLDRIAPYWYIFFFVLVNQAVQIGTLPGILVPYWFGTLPNRYQTGM